MDDGEQADMDTRLKLDITVAQAEEVIRAVLTHRRPAKSLAPDAQRLADGINSLRIEYDLRHTMDSMATLKDLETAYKQLTRASRSLQGAVADIQKSFWALYFIAVLDQGPGVSEDGEYDPSELNAARVLAGRLIGYASEALKEIDAARGPEGAERWYEHEERRASFWLYRQGLPCLYKQIFGSAYSISGEMHATRPSLRFAQAVLALAGLPITSAANLRSHAKRKR